MIDLPIIPSVPPSNVASSTDHHGKVTLSIPQGIETIAKGDVVTATIIRSSAFPSPLLQLQSPSLSQSLLPITSKLALPDGAQLTLKITSNSFTNTSNTNTSPILTAQVLSINGNPPTLPAGISPQSDYATLRTLPLPPTTLQSSSSPLVTPTATNAPTTLATTLHTLQGSTIHATVLSTQATQPTSTTIPTFFSNPLPPSPTFPLSIQPSDTLTLSIINITPPHNVTKETPASLPNITQTQSPPNSITPPLSTLANTSLPPTTPLPQNTLITGIVIGTTQSGETILQTPTATLSVSLPSPTPQGTTLSLALLTHQPINNANKTILPPLLLPQHSKETIEALATTLASPTAPLSLPSIQQQFPNIMDKQFAASLLWFIAGSSKGDATLWLGKTHRQTLENAGHRSLLNKLDQTFINLKTMWQEPSPQGWVSLPFPLWDGETIQFGMFHLHQNPDQEEGEDVAANRFLVELELENTGEIQIDGLVHNNAARFKIDLIIRTHIALPASMQHDIITIFEEANAHTGLHGTLQFQTLHHFPVEIIPSPPTSSSQHDNHGIIA